MVIQTKENNFLSKVLRIFIQISDKAQMAVPRPAMLHSRIGRKNLSLSTSLLLIIFVARVAPRSYVETEYSQRKYQTEGPDLDPARYLQKFGYLPGSDFETGALRTEEEFSRAIRELQTFANIPVTGKLDRTTVSMMNKSRCGNRDYLESKGHHVRDLSIAPHGLSSSGTAVHEPQHYFLGPSKWQKKWLSFRLLNYTPDLSRADARDAIIRAFHVWSKFIPITFHEVDSGYADIYIQFSSGYHQDGYPFDGKGGILAHAFFPGEERGGDVHFDEDERWTVYSAEGTNLFIVSAHELGHSLGLAHSNVAGSLMYPWHQGYKSDFQLHPDDIMAIQSLYGAKNPPQVPPQIPPQKPTPVSTSKPVVTTRTTTTTTTTTSRKPPTTNKSTRPTTKHSPKPSHPHHENFDDECDTYVDAISVIRGELFIFKADKFWRINKLGLVNLVPTVTNSFWGVPKHVEKIDAVFERPSDNRIIFFSGKLYWELHGISISSGFPHSGRRITDFGLPEDLEMVDAAFVWGHNKKVYIVSGDMYWRLNDTTKRVDYGYPRDMSMWEGVKLPVDAAFTNKEGVTYFFHGPFFWEFNDARMRVRHEHHPGHVGQHWLNCTPVRVFHEKFTGEDEVRKEADVTSSQAGSGPINYFLSDVVMALISLIILTS